MAAPHPKQLASFVRATAVLALSASQQEAWLASLAIQVPVDELALEFDDGHHLLPQWVDAGWLPSASVPAFSVLDRALAEMSGKEHADLWSLTALHDAPEWAHVRALAAEVLLAL